jgi:aminoglycoside phosphotransferase (APT) family kinase protein
VHSGQTEVTAAQVRALLAAQMPELAALPLKRVGLTGTDNVLYRIGLGMVGRFPRLPHAEAQISTQAQWLPRLADALPLAVPLTLRFGLPGEGYPFRWTVLPWLPGHAAFAGPLDQGAAALALAGFLQALQAQPRPDAAPLRGEADLLSLRFAELGQYIGQFQGEADPLVLAKVAAVMRRLPPHDGKPVWVHGDLHPLNLLALRGRLIGVIDWGGLGLGDPATDLMIGWTLFDAPARQVFQDALQPSPEAWARGRALAFAKAVAAIPYYRRSNPGFRDVMLRTLARVLEDAAER